MKESVFQFKNPKLVDMEFKIGIENNETMKESGHLDLSANVYVNKFHDTPEAIVELTVIIGSEDGTSPYYIKATEGAVFRWDESVNGEEDRLLKQNAPAILIGYLRPIIAMITAASPFETYNIPAINFME